MTTPNPDDFSLLAKVIAAGTAVAAPITWLWTKLDKKADRHTVNNQLNEIKLDVANNRAAIREDIRNLYQNAEADRKSVRDGFDRLSQEIHETHIALLNRIDVK